MVLGAIKVWVAGLRLRYLTLRNWREYRRHFDHIHIGKFDKGGWNG